MSKYLFAILALLLILSLWRIDYVTAQRDAQSKARATSEAVAKSLRNTLQLSRDLLTERDALDTQATKELSDANTQIDQLLGDIRAGKRRLSVAARCPSVRAAGDPGAARLDDAGTRAELDPATAGRIVNITGDGDAGLIALRGLQHYIAGVCLKRSIKE